MTELFFAAVSLFAIAPGFSQIPAQSKNANAQKALTGRLISEASSALSSDDLTRAAEILRRILSTEPENLTAQTLAGITADKRNDLAAAEKHFAAAAKIAPAMPETRNNYGAILLRLDRRKEAAAEFTASLKANPNQLSALVNLAQIRLSENEFSDARDLFVKAKIINPDAEILRALVLISLKLKEKERAAAEFRDYFEFAKLAPETGKTDLQNEILLGRELLANELFDEARQELEFILSRNPSDITALVLLSRAFLAQKDIRAAGRLLESAVARGIRSAEIYAALSDIYKAGGFLENAIPAMRLAIEEEPKNEFYYARYGLLLIDSKAPAAAVIRLEEAVREFPGSARLWLALGIARQTEGKALEARESFRKSLEIQPESIPALAYLANSMIENADYEEAFKIYRRALLLDEKSAILHFLLADTLLKIPSSKPEDIQKHLLRSIEIDARIAPAHLSLGKLYARAGNWEKAAAEFELAVKFSPESPEGFYQLGLALSRLQRKTQAQAAFEKYKQLNESRSTQKEIDRQELIRRLANVSF